MNQRFTGLVINGLYKEKILVKFLFYYFPIISNFCKSHLNTSSFPSVDMNELKKFNIPIPPITLQQKVVDILDKFESLISSLTEGLPAEMKIRRQQYEYYRNKLLTFEKNEYV
jgi:type I restriction enzyme S subunit